MSVFEITEHKKIDTHITFIRLKPNDLSITLNEIFLSLSNLSWLDNFDADYLKSSYEKRARITLDNLRKKLLSGDTDELTTNTGEIVVSELARKSIIETLDYSDIPLAELFKQKKDGNPGFDFFTENKEEIILFGEAKYIARTNGYGRAFSQIADFIKEGKDISDFVDIERFCSENSLVNSNSGSKGYIAAFSSTEMDTETLIDNIKSNANFKELTKHKEIICVAVDVII